MNSGSAQHHQIIGPGHDLHAEAVLQCFQEEVQPVDGEDAGHRAVAEIPGSKMTMRPGR